MQTPLHNHLYTAQLWSEALLGPWQVCEIKMPSHMIIAVGVEPAVGMFLKEPGLLHGMRTACMQVVYASRARVLMLRTLHTAS